MTTERNSVVTPQVLVISDGRFRSLSDPLFLATVGSADGEYRQPELPETVPDPWTGERSDVPPEPPVPSEVYLTIDAEDKYFSLPHQLTGEGIGEQYGAYGILDILDRYDLRATWFVNVYEVHRHDDPTTLERLVKAIDERGHEVALHTHYSEDLELYPRPLYLFNAEQQKEILGYGADLIERWTGRHPVSFRAGSYELNDETFEALESLGFRIDSSVFFSSKNNRITPFTVSAVRVRRGIIEVPVTYVPLVQSDGHIEHRKFDVNWLTGDELDQVVDRVSEFGIGQAMFMMHSFSFIDRESLPKDHPGTSRALYRSPRHGSRFVEIYGPDPKLRERFERFAERLARDHRVEVKTLASAADGLEHRAAARYPDISPVVSRATAPEPRWRAVLQRFRRQFR